MSRVNTMLDEIRAVTPETIQSAAKKYLTADKVKVFFSPIVKGKVLRYDIDTLNSLEFVMHNALGGGATRTLCMDQTGKAYGPNMLRMEFEADE